MIECLVTELHDIGVATQMVIMATGTFLPAHATAPVKTPVATHVLIDLPVTVQTQAALALLAEGLMTLAALRLVPGVSLYQPARHDHGLNHACHRTGSRIQACYDRDHAQQNPAHHRHGDSRAQ
jgi:hypothetical protein